MYCYLPELIIVGTILIGLLYSLGNTVYMDSFVLFGGMIAFAASVALWVFNPLPDYEIYKINPYTGFCKMVILGFYGCIHFLNMQASKPSDLLKPEFSLLVLFSVLGTLIMLSAQDFLTLFLSIELQTFPLYIICGLCRNSKLNNEAALKYFILGVIASALYLYGTSLIYGVNGSIKFSEFNGTSAETVLLSVAIGLICSSFFFKLSMAPFHMWTPDVYQGTPSSVTLLIAVLPKLAFLMVCMQLLAGPFAGFRDVLQNIFVGIGCISLLWGTLGALRQSSFKRLLAYSTISHMGYICLGLSVCEEAAFSNVLLYILAYSISIVGIFSILLRLKYLEEDISLDYFTGLSKSHPAVAFAMAVFLLSMAGIPPLAGFFTKFSLFFTAISAGLYSFVCIGALATLIGAYYYLKIIKIMYFDVKDTEVRPLQDFTCSSIFCSSTLIIYSCTGGTLLLFWGMPDLLNILKQTVSYIFIGSFV